MADWIMIRTEYVTTSISLNKLAEKYNIPYSTLKDRADREGWVRERREFAAKTVKNNKDAIAEQEEEIAQLKSSIRKSLFKRCKEIADSIDSTPADLQKCSTIYFGLVDREPNGLEDINVDDGFIDALNNLAAEVCE